MGICFGRKNKKGSRCSNIFARSITYKFCLNTVNIETNYTFLSKVTPSWFQILSPQMMQGRVYVLYYRNFSNAVLKAKNKLISISHYQQQQSVRYTFAGFFFLCSFIISRMCTINCLNHFSKDKIITIEVIILEMIHTLLAEIEKQNPISKISNLKVLDMKSFHVPNPFLVLI